MLTYFFSKGSSALAAHILLLEAKADFEPVEVSIHRKEHLAPAFLAKNPKGRVPALETPDGIITENPAILEYIAATHPETKLLPQGLFAQTQARSLAAYLCSTVHIAFSHSKRGPRWATQETSFKDMKSVVLRNLTACAAIAEDELALDPWAMGATYTFVDPYLFLLGRWLGKAGGSLDATPKLAAHAAAMRARPATQAALAAHDEA